MAQGWGAHRTSGPSRNGRLWLRRGLATLALALLAAWLGWLLVRPLMHPRTHLVLLAGDVMGAGWSLGDVPADFVVEDFRALLSLESALDRGIGRDPKPLVLGSLRSPDVMQHLADRLNERITGHNDVLLLYVSAHGLVQDGDAWLIASGADSHAPLGGRYRLASLLAQVRECKAATKLLVLDAGRMEFDLLLGIVENDFSTRLVEQVEQLGDPALWVLVSHAAGQRSQLSPALRRSVFGYFVAAGMKSAADANADHVIDLPELSQFVTSGVSGWVRQTTGGTAEQTPRLTWGGGDFASSPKPTLLPVPITPKSEPPTLDHAKAVEIAQEPPAAQDETTERGIRELNTLISTGIARSTPSGRLGHMASDAARRAIAKVTNGAKLPGAAASPAGEPAAKAEDPSKELAPNGKVDAKTPAGDEKDKNGAADKGKSQKKKGDAPIAQAAGPAAAESASQKPAITADQLAVQLERAWRMHDELANSDRPAARPVDYAPHSWREIERRLLMIDRKLRTGFVPDLSAMEPPLRELVEALEALAAGKLPDELPSGSLARRIAESRPGRSLANVQPSSLALAELIDREGGTALPPELSPVIAQLDHIIAAGNRTDLEKLAAELKPEHDRWHELRLVRRLAARPDLDWRIVHLLADATRLGEKAAAGSYAAGSWVNDRVEQADALRLTAEQEIFGATKPQRESLIAQLSAARDEYSAALAELAAIRSSTRLANDVWLRLPEYLAWNAAAAGATVIGPSDAELLDLMTKLEAMDRALADRGPEKSAATGEAAALLSAARKAVERQAAPLVIEQLLAGPATPGEAWRMELLLESSIPAADNRQALAGAIAAVDAAAASQVETSVEAVSNHGQALAAADDLRFAARARLVQRWIEIGLTGLDVSGLEGMTKSPLTIVPVTVAGEDSDAASLQGRRDSFSDRVQDVLRNLPAEIARGIESETDVSAVASRGARLDRLRSWSRALRLVDPRLESRAAEAALQHVLADAAAYDLLVWQSARALRAAEDAPPTEGTFLKESAAAYRTAAVAIPGQPPLVGGSQSPLELSGPLRIALTYHKEKEAEFAVRNTSPSRQKAWVAMEADDELVQATSIVDRKIYAWTELLASGASSEKQATIEQRAARLPPTVELAPGQSVRLPLRLLRRGTSQRPSHLVLRAITSDGMARHDVTIDLPPPEDLGLLVAGNANRWSPLPAGAELLPYPNRVNAFALMLTNDKPAERNVDVEVVPLLTLPPQGIPSVPLSAADADRLRSEMSVGPVVAEAKAVVLPPGGEPVGLVLKKPEAAPQPMPTAGKAAAGPPGADSAAAAPPPSDKPPPVPLPQGLLVTITDLADKRQTFRQLDISPQRPQRYVKAQVRYRAGRERIEIRVSPQDTTPLPADGVRIHGEIVEPLPIEAERQLDAVLKPGQDEAEMYVEVPAAPDSTVTLRLTIDDYPRAMVFRVPTSGETSDVPEDFDLLTVRVAGLPDGTIYKPPTASLPVQLAIDAPASALKNPPLKVEVGIDQNRDRELRGDEVVLLTADRQVTAALVGVSKSGELQIETTVRDITIDVPAAAIAGGRANVLAHAVLGDKEAWSEPVEIAIDGQLPRVSAIEMRPAVTAVIGKPVIVSALADDLGLSGIAQLEAAFDADRSGKFGPATKAVAGALGADGRWSASVPTAGLTGGSYNILVRAIDKAGNKGEPARAAIRLVAEEDAAAAASKSAAADITGVVSYGDEPQAGVTVNLTRDTGAPLPKSKAKTKGKAPPPPLAQTRTDASGQFKFPKVAPGKYVVVAEALVRNKNRAADAPVAFAKPAEVQPLALKLK